MTHVPYKGGGPLVNDAIAGHVPIAIASIALLSPHIKSGALRPLAVTSVKRVAQLPDTPAVSELGVPGSTPCRGGACWRRQRRRPRSSRG